jgi:TRAP-type C4-dicarboxylate transport system permease small subunit
MIQKKAFLTIYKIVGAISTVCLWCSVVAVAGIAILNTVDSLDRYIRGKALFGASEWVSVAMCVFVFGGLCMAVRERKCISVPVLTDYLKPAARLIVLGTGNILCCAAAALMVSQLFVTSQRYFANQHLGSDMINIPFWPFYFFATAATAVIALEFLCVAVKDLYEGFTWNKGHPELPDARRVAGICFTGTRRNG